MDCPHCNQRINIIPRESLGEEVGWSYSGLVNEYCQDANGIKMMFQKLAKEMLFAKNQTDAIRTLTIQDSRYLKSLISLMISAFKGAGVEPPVAVQVSSHGCVVFLKNPPIGKEYDIDSLISVFPTIDMQVKEEDFK